MNSTEGSAVLKYFNFGFFKDFFNVVFSDFIESDSFFRDNPWEYFTLKLIIRTVNIDGFCECLKDSSVVCCLILRALSDS